MASALFRADPNLSSTPIRADTKGACIRDVLTFRLGQGLKPLVDRGDCISSGDEFLSARGALC